MPFTPWTTPRDVLDIVDFVAAHDLVANVDPVQYTIRLLVPEGSLLLERQDLREHLGPYDPSASATPGGRRTRRPTGSRAASARWSSRAPPPRRGRG